MCSKKKLRNETKDTTDASEADGHTESEKSFVTSLSLSLFLSTRQKCIQQLGKGEGAEERKKKNGKIVKDIKHLTNESKWRARHCTQIKQRAKKGKVLMLQSMNSTLHESGVLFCSIVLLCTRWLDTSNAHTQTYTQTQCKENWVCCFQWKGQI